MQVKVCQSFCFLTLGRLFLGSSLFPGLLGTLLIFFDPIFPNLLLLLLFLLLPVLSLHSFLLSLSLSFLLLFRLGFHLHFVLQI
jgi:hypothetical protein